MSNKTSKLPLRETVALEHTWKLEDLFASDALWETTRRQTRALFPKLEDYKGKLNQGAQILFECLKLSDEIAYEVERLYVYANMRLHQDGGNSHYQSFSDMAQTLLTDFSSSGSFIDSEILTIPKKEIMDFLQSHKGLRLYTHYIENLLAKKDHVLDSKTEHLLAQVSELGQGPQTIFTMFNNADLVFPSIENEDGEKVQITHGRFIQFLESTNPRVRKDAFLGMYNTYSGYKNMLASTFSANVKQFAFFARTRNYESPRVAALSANHIPVSVYDTLIETVHEHLPLMHDYVVLRKKLLNLDELHMYDLYTPMVPDMDTKISYEEAWDTILEALTPMGHEYIALLKEARENRWIDRYENQGKRSGAYSWGAYGTHPYVLLNHNNNLNSMFTLAHEMGHALHTHYSNTNQPYVYAGYTIFVAEVASTVNESLLMQYLLKNARDKKEKAYLINYFMEQFRGTVYRQTMFAEFEKIMHEKQQDGQALTVDLISNEYYELVKQYHGNDIVVDKEIAMEWARIPHFYRPFYVYQYATGFSAAIAISQRILKEATPAVEDYIEFLKGGSSKHPLDLLKIAGVDMSTPEPIEQALGVFEGLLKEMSELV